MAKEPKKPPVIKRKDFDDPNLVVKNPAGHEDPFFIKKPEIIKPDLKINPDPKKYPGNDWHDKP